MCPALSVPVGRDIRDAFTRAGRSWLGMWWKLLLRSCDSWLVTLVLLVNILFVILLLVNILIVTLSSLSTSFLSSSLLSPLSSSPTSVLPLTLSLLFSRLHKRVFRACFNCTQWSVVVNSVPLLGTWSNLLKSTPKFSLFVEQEWAPGWYCHLDCAMMQAGSMQASQSSSRSSPSPSPSRSS